MKKFWVTSQEGFFREDVYYFYNKKSTFKHDKYNYFNAMLERDSMKFFGLKLKPGEIVPCELKVIKKG